jgi:hypothetical protein
MNVTFINGPRANSRILQIDDARIIRRNFAGRQEMYNAEGERNFLLVIPEQDIADALINDLNEFGVGWNVMIKDAREEGEPPFMFLTVKVKFNAKGPNIYLISGNKRVELDENTIDILDDIDIQHVNLDIRAYDGEGRFGPFRSAYLHSMEVYQEVDRFAARYAEEDSYSE